MRDFRFFAVFRFETFAFSSVFSAAQRRNLHQPMAPLCNGSCRGATEGLFGKHRIRAEIHSKRLRKSFLIVSEYLQKFPFLCGEKTRTNQRLPPRGSCRKATEGECATCVFLPYSVLKLLLLPLLSLRHKAENCTDSWLP